MKRLMICCIALAAFIYSAKAQTVIASKDAAKHIGDSVTVTAKVFGGKLFTPSNMTLLDLGGENPNQDLTVMIGGLDRAKFSGAPEVDYKGKDVTVTGKIISYKGKPEIVVTNPKQLKLVMVDNMRNVPVKFE